MAKFTTLKAKVVTIVQGTLIDGSNTFGSSRVFNYEPEIAAVDVDPFAVIIASGNENDFVSTSENRRTYAFVIRVFVERKNRGVESAESVLQTIIDNLIDKLDQDYTLTGSALTSQAAPSAWGYVLGDKEYRYAEVVLRAKVDFDVTA